MDRFNFSVAVVGLLALDGAGQAFRNANINAEVSVDTTVSVWPH